MVYHDKSFDEKEILTTSTANEVNQVSIITKKLDLLYIPGEYFRSYIKVVLIYLDKSIAFTALINIGATASMIHNKFLPNTCWVPTKMTFITASDKEFFSSYYTKPYNKDIPSTSLTILVKMLFWDLVFLLLVTILFPSKWTLCPKPTTSSLGY